MSISLFERSNVVSAVFFCLLLVFAPTASNAQNDAVFIDDPDTVLVTDAFDWSKSLAEQQFLTEVQQSWISSLSR